VKRRNDLYYLAGLTALTTLLVYLPALRNDFVELDDAVYVLDNPFIRSFDGTMLRWAFFHFFAANWHPLAWISHALDYAVWGLDPLGHHLTNIILHAVNTFVVVLLAARLLSALDEKSTDAGSPALSKDRMILIAAGLTGLLFGLHPVHVESVAWVAERKDLLCALFFLLSILWYTKYANCAASDADTRRAPAKFFNEYYIAALGFFVLALLSKPMAVTLPLVLLLLDWFPYSRIHNMRTFWSAVIEKLPFIGLSLASSILTILAQKAGEALVSAQMVPLSDRVLVAARSLLGYLGNMVLPSDLAPYYPYPGLHEISLYRAEYLIPVILVTLITTVCIKVMQRQKIWLAVWCYYVITLLPVLGIVQVGGQAMADRYTYLPGLGPFLLVGLAGAWIYAWVNARVRNPQLMNRLGFAIAIAVILLLSTLTIRQIGIWKNSMVVFDAILAKDSRRSPMVYFHRGVAFEKAGQVEKAIDDYTKAISLFPSYYEAFFSRGTAYDRMGRLDRAIEDYSVAISLKPASYEAYTNRGLVNKKMGRKNEAFSDFERAIALSESAGKAYFNLGVMHAEAGLFDKAIDDFNRAIAVDGMDADAYSNRGIVNALVGRNSPALDDFNKAIALDGRSAVAYYNRGKLYSTTGQNELAFADFRKACELGDEDGCNTLRSGLK
jgi:protein O-mannosyl-transferase